MRRFSAGLYLVAVWFAGAPACMRLRAQEAAQTAVRQQAHQPAERPSTIKAVTEEVLLDLVARDRRGRPVRDLKPDQIEVYEDGVKQPITYFQLVEGEAPLTEAEAAAPQSNFLRQINLVTLLFERLGDDGRKNARQAALEFLRSELRPNVYVAVFRSDQRLYVLQHFTNDRKRLEQAVEQVTGASSSQLASQSESIFRDLERARAELEGTNQAASAASSASQAATSGPGSSGPSGSPGAAMAAAKMAEMTVNMLRTADMLERAYVGRSSLYALLALVREQRSLPGRKTIIYYSEGLRITPGLADLLRSIISEANRSNVSVYSVDARGLVTSEVTGAARRNLLGAESSGVVTGTLYDESSAQRSIAGESAFEAGARANVQDTLADLSESTGGFLVANTNEMGTAMRRIAEDIHTYYVAAYRPPAREYDGKFHRISMKVLRPGITLQTRSGYYAIPPIGGSPVLAYEAPMLAALAASPAEPGFEYRAQALHFGYSNDGVQYQMVMEVPTGSFSFVEDPGGKTVRAHFSVLALVKDSEGKVAQKFSQDSPLEGPAGKMEDLKAGNVIFTRNFRLVPGRYTLETVAFDQETKKASVFRSVLVVPPPPQGVSMSSVSVVERVDPLPPAERNDDDPLQIQSMKIIPNLGDPIRKGSAAGVPVYFVVYPSQQVAEKPQAKLEFLRGGQVVAVAPVELPAPDATGRIAYLGSIPTDKLDPGRYEIRALVSQGPATAVEYAVVSVNR